MTITHMDLSNVYDHPAAVLRSTADAIAGRYPITVEDGDAARSLHVAAATLDSYERAHSVTFAALDKDTLASLREAYDRLSDSDQYEDRVIAANDVANAVRDLLGFDNQ